jgi:hemerythrin superfamily protein
MNALELLTADHQRVSDLFEQLQQADDIDQKRDIFELIRDELIAHADIEERMFYPLFRNREGFEDLIDESVDDHAEVKDLIEEIDSLDDESELEDRFDELQEVVEGHVNEEEHELFPKVREVMDEAALEQLGDEMMGAKETPSRAA